MIDRNEVLGALSGVRDPELDEPITDLDFVSSLEIEDDNVRVRLRLPTYFCAPNFAYLMVADAQAAALSVPGVERATIFLDDHYASDEINGGVNDQHGFDGAFPGETAAEARVPLDAHPDGLGEPQVLHDRLLGHPVAVRVHDERRPGGDVEADLGPALQVGLELLGGGEVLQPHPRELLGGAAVGAQAASELLLAGD